MGGVKEKAEEAWEGTKKTVKKGATSATKIVTGGSYNPDTGYVGLGSRNVGNMVSGYVDPAVEFAAETGIVNMGGPSKAPTAQGLSDQEAEAKAAAEEAARRAVGDAEKGQGLSSTILGGGLGDDDSKLKKRRLLGE